MEEERLTDFDVVVAGYGPVGQLLALLLGRRGWRVGVYERQARRYGLPRAVHYDDEVARILDAAGASSDLARVVEPIRSYEWQTAGGDTLLRFEWPERGPSGWPVSTMFSQPDLETLLDAHVRAQGSVLVEHGSEVADIDQAADAVGVSVRATDGGSRSVRGQYVVGCDGANSFVRQAAGVELTDLGFAYDWLIVDVVPGQPRAWDPPAVQVCDPARPTTMVPGGPGRRRWEFMRLPGETIVDLDRADAAWRLLQPWGVDPTNATLERHAVYTFHARWAQSWHHGRVLLAGDAAHQMPPFAGQGLCAGLRDAFNLAWRLDLLLSGRASSSLLDAYTGERLGQVRQWIDASVELGKVICVTDHDAAAARDQGMLTAPERSFNAPPPAFRLGPGTLRDGDPLAGTLSPQGIVADDCHHGRFDDVAGRGWLLLSVGGDPGPQLDVGARALLDSLQARLVWLTRDGAGGSLADADGTYHDWLGAAGRDVVLIRPDFYVYGSAESIDGVNSLIGDLGRRLDRG